VEKTTYTGFEARDATYAILDAVRHIHSCGILHRDLKSESLLLRSKDDDRDLKVADFGFAKQALEEDSLATLCGNLRYVSRRSCGRCRMGRRQTCGTSASLCSSSWAGIPPCQHPDQAEQFKRRKCGTYEFAEGYWRTITDKAKSLIQSLLDTDPRRRL
ncbi:hypothetical protein ACHAWF_006411, partial [Thalassiosira exigua]